MQKLTTNKKDEMKKQIIYMCINLEKIFPKYNIIGHLRLREISYSLSKTISIL